MQATGAQAFLASYTGDTNHYAVQNEELTVTVSAKNTQTLPGFEQTGWTFGSAAADPSYTTPVGTTKTTVRYTGTTTNGDTYGPTADKPTEAGSYTVTVTCETEDTIYTGTKGFTVERQSIASLNVSLAEDRFVYDGNEKTPAVTVKNGSADLARSEYSIVYTNNRNAGDAAVTVKDTGKGNYRFGTVYAPFTITQRALTLPNASVRAKAYDGATAATVLPGALNGIVSGDDVRVAESSVSGTFASQYVGSWCVALNANFTLTGAQAGSYTLTPPSVTGNITAAEQTPVITQTAQLPRGGKTLDLSRLISSAQGTVHFAISAGDEYAELNGCTLTSKDSVGTVKVTITADAADLNGDGIPEYATYTQADAITVAITLKAAPTVTPPTGAADLVYDGNEHTLISAGAAIGGEMLYKLANGTYSTQLPAAANAGTYTIWYQVIGDEDHEDSAEQSFPVAIKQKPVTVTPKDVTITQNAPLPDFELVYSGLVGDDMLTPLDTLTFVIYEQDSDTVVTAPFAAGSYRIFWSNANTVSFSGAENYEVHPDAYAVLTINPVRNGQKMTISTPNRTPGGTLELTPKNAKPGDTVTIRVTPDRGYTLGGLTVRDGAGDPLGLTRESDTEYTFIMPKSSVSVSGHFVREGDALGFVDVPTSSYYYDAVQWAVTQGITNGTDKTHFSPNSPCTRAQIVTFLWRAAGSPEPASMSGFVDVPENAYYAKAVAWAAEQGIARGTDATHFDPNGICTRAHAVTFLARAVHATGDGKTPFTDVPEAAYYAPAVKWAADNGVTDGIGGGLFGPHNDCTRAQIVTFLWRLYAKV